MKKKGRRRWAAARLLSVAALFCLLLLFGGVGIVRQENVETCDVCCASRLTETIYIAWDRPGRFAEGHRRERRPLGFPISTRTLKQTTALDSTTQCEHHWRPGVRSAVGRPIEPGEFILVMRGKAYGAFRILPLPEEGESVSYEWFYRLDGKGHFLANDDQVASGRATDALIRFGPFVIGWSLCTDTSGWIYYDHEAFAPIPRSPQRLCVTGLRSLEGLDATDSKWVYRASPSDPGVRGTGQVE